MILGMIETYAEALKNGFGGLFQYISLPTIGSKSFDTDIAYYSQLLEPSLQHEEFVCEECMH